MSIVYGTGFYGKVSKLNGQWIETKFFHIWFVPLFPITTMFVTSSSFRSRQGTELALDKRSIIAAYVRFFALLMVAWYVATVVIFTNEFDYFTEQSRFSATLLGYVKLAFFVSLWAYFSFSYGKASIDEVGTRNKIGSVCGLYALPHWITEDQTSSLLNACEAEYNQHYPGTHWKEELKSSAPDTRKLRLLFGLALFTYMLHPSAEHEALYEKADELYQV